MTLKGFRSCFLTPQALQVLLAVSMLANIVSVQKLYFPNAVDNLLAAMASPPGVEASDHIRGNPNAKVTVIVYTDFECPYCARLHANLLTLLGRKDFRLIYRHFPLASHEHAEHAAEAAECAGVQDKFWEYGDALFKSIRSNHDDVYFRRIASNLGLNQRGFVACLSSGQFGSRVAGQRADGQSRRLMAVPTFFVNGKRFNGAIPIEQLESYLTKSGA